MPIGCGQAFCASQQQALDVSFWCHLFSRLDFFSPHFTSSNFISFHLIHSLRFSSHISHLVSSNLTSFHLMSCFLKCFHVISSRFVSFRVVSPLLNPSQLFGVGLNHFQFSHVISAKMMREDVKTKLTCETSLKTDS